MGLVCALAGLGIWGLRGMIVTWVEGLCADENMADDILARVGPESSAAIWGGRPGSASTLALLAQLDVQPPAWTFDARRGLGLDPGGAGSAGATAAPPGTFCGPTPELLECDRRGRDLTWADLTRPLLSGAGGDDGARALGPE